MRRLFNFTVYGCLFLILLSPGVMLKADSISYPSDRWESSTPEAQGMDSNRLADLWEMLQTPDSNIQGSFMIHSLLIIRHGRVVMDASVYPFSTARPHETFSLTKSVLSALVGIAISRGEIQSLDQSIWDYFPADETAAMDERKTALTLRHLLNHTSGIGANDRDLTGLDVDGETVLQHILNAPAVAAPGTRYNYLDSNAHLVSALLQRATGMSALEFARKTLFTPLGITDVEWAADAEGVTYGAAGLIISTYDIARIGYLYLHDGSWNGQQIVPSEWVQQSTRDALEPLQPHFWEGYSNYWYNGPYGYWYNENAGHDAAHRGFAAIGSAGQSLYVMPDLDIIVVTTGDIGYQMVFNNGLTDYVIQAVQSDTALPASTVGTQRLQQLLDMSGHPAPLAIDPLPELAAEINGKTYKLAANQPGWTSISLTFDNPDQAVLHLTLADRTYDLPVGLDGVFRVSEQPVIPGGMLWHTVPWFIKGRWTGKAPQSTFEMELWDITGQDGFILSFDFNKSRLRIKSILWPEEFYAVTAQA